VDLAGTQVLQMVIMLTIRTLEVVRATAGCWKGERPDGATP
jgi:hypothetical protein